MTKKPSGLFHLGYRVTVALKGIDGALEVALGLLVAVAGTQRLADLILSIIVPELEQHPGSRVLHAAQHGANKLSQNSGHFAIFYLLIHGLLKVAIAYNLLREKEWIFVPSFVVLTGFILFMSLHLMAQWSAWLFGLMLLDVVTLALVVNEYFRLRAKA